MQGNPSNRVWIVLAIIIGGMMLCVTVACVVLGVAGDILLSILGG